VAACFILVGKPLPRVEDSLRIGELMRIATMGQCKRFLGEDHIPPIFSGHALPAGNRHRPASYPPWDSNGDGRLDRILVFVPDGMNFDQQQALTAVNRLWDRDGHEWRLALEASGPADIATALVGNNMGGCIMWESVTPYLHPWHVKR